MKKLTLSGANLIQWIAIFALLLFVVGCSRFGDVLGPQSSNNTEAASGTFEPIIYDYPEAANYAPAGYELINFHVKAVGRLDDGDGDGDDDPPEDEYHDNYEMQWDVELNGQEYEGVASQVYCVEGARIGWDDSGITIPSGALPEEGLWITMTRSDPPEPWIDFGPHGTQFNVLVTLRISYRNCELPEGMGPEDLQLFYWNEDTGEYELISETNNQEEEYLEGQTDHFSRYIIAARR